MVFDPTYHPRVLVLYTGGTVGMQPNADGALVPVKGFLAEKLAELEELQRPGMPSVEVLEFDPLLDSSDVGPSHWIEMAQIIERSYFDYDGFVIVHGTDTMAYSSSALSFMFENLSKPVVFTGSMMPFGEVHSDARRNLIVSILIAGQGTVCEVTIFFNETLYRGNRSIKLDNKGIAAFDSPNYPPLATLGVDIVTHEHRLRKASPGRFVAHKELDSRILVLRLVPEFIDLDCLHIDGNNALHAVVLQLYGTGNAPSLKKDFTRWVSRLINSGVIVAVVSQCIHGAVELHKYAVGAQLIQEGVLSAHDMTCEAAVTKLSYLLGRGLSQEQIRLAFEQNLRGERSEAKALVRGTGGLLAKL